MTTVVNYDKDPAISANGQEEQVDSAIHRVELDADVKRIRIVVTAPDGTRIVGRRARDRFAALFRSRRRRTGRPSRERASPTGSTAGRTSTCASGVGPELENRPRLRQLPRPSSRSLPAAEPDAPKIMDDMLLEFGGNG